jgi:hypothetical protein
MPATISGTPILPTHGHCTCSSACSRPCSCSTRARARSRATTSAQQRERREGWGWSDQPTGCSTCGTFGDTNTDPKGGITGAGSYQCEGCFLGISAAFATPDTAPALQG